MPAKSINHNKIVIIGKNSKISKNIENYLNGKYECQYLSHNENFNICFDKNVLLLSVSKYDINENNKIIFKLIESKPSNVILISSLSIYSIQNRYYKYPLIKLNQENMIFDKLRNIQILRIGTINNNKNIGRIPDIITTYDELYEYIAILLYKNGCNIFEVYNKEGELKKSDLLLNYIYTFRFLPTVFTRCIDILRKILTNRNYGYALQIFIKLK